MMVEQGVTLGLAFLLLWRAARRERTARGNAATAQQPVT